MVGVSTGAINKSITKFLGVSVYPFLTSFCFAATGVFPANSALYL